MPKQPTRWRGAHVNSYTPQHVPMETLGTPTLASTTSSATSGSTTRVLGLTPASSRLAKACVKGGVLRWVYDGWCGRKQEGHLLSVHL